MAARHATPARVPVGWIAAGTVATALCLPLFSAVSGSMMRTVPARDAAPVLSGAVTPGPGIAAAARTTATGSGTSRALTSRSPSPRTGPSRAPSRLTGDEPAAPRTVTRR